MRRTSPRIAALTALLGAALALGGCSNGVLHGIAAMQIEVEVYTGPPLSITDTLDTERLQAVENWSNVNTVHASSRGEVSMAFIKDAIGNWNLRSFDDELERLHAAYQQVDGVALGRIEALHDATRAQLESLLGAGNDGTAAARRKLVDEAAAILERHLRRPELMQDAIRLPGR